MSKKIMSLCLNLCTVLAVILALLINYLQGEVLTRASFMYFTILSNLGISVTSAMFVILDIISAITGKNLKCAWMYSIKYVMTVSICLTFFVFSLLLTEKMSREYLISAPNILTHYIVPLLALADFMLWDTLPEKCACTMSPVLPLSYLICCLICSIGGADFGNGAIVPYFFLDYTKLGWFSISRDGIGVFYWMALLMGVLLGISHGLISIKYATINPISRQKLRIHDTRE